MGLLDIVRAAVPAAAAARGGYKLGQQQAEEARRAEAERQAERQQRSLLEQVRLAREQRLLSNAEAPDPDQWSEVSGAETPTVFNRRTGETKPLAGVTRRQEPKAPVMGSPAWLKAQEEAAKIRARHRAPRESEKPPTPDDQRKTLRDEIRENLTAVRGQIGDTQRKLGDAQESLEPDERAIGGLSTRLDSLGRVSDSLATELQRNSARSTARSATPAKTVITRDQAAFLMQRKGWTREQVNAKYTVAP